ncbi:MAG: serine/threonine-protein kinase, partial [Cyanobacteria bacterium J06648_11]
MDSSEEQSDGHDAFEGLRRELGEAFAEFPRSGEFFGGVELIEPLGEGAQGTVWRARVPSSGEIVAIKALQFFDRDGVASSAKAKQFVEDMRRARAVQNRNVVEVFGAGCEESWIWVTQELVEGGRTLHDEIIEQQRRSVPESDWHIRAAKFCYEVASGVAALHANGIVHRDIKPANVLISSNGTAKIADLGLIKRAARQPLESEETVVGTGAYLAPEVLMGGCKADVVTDVYSVGVLIYETCTLYRPIPGQSLLEIFRGQLRINPIAPHLISQTPEPLSRVCMRCIERWPSRRYREAKEVAAELARVIEGERLMTPRIAGARWCWRRIEERWLEVLALVLLFGVAVLALVLHGERSRVLDARRADELLAGEGELMIVPGCLEALRRSIAQGLTLRSERVRQLIEKEFVIGANGLITWGLMRRE